MRRVMSQGNTSQGARVQIGWLVTPGKFGRQRYTGSMARKMNRIEPVIIAAAARELHFPQAVPQQILRY